MKKRILVAETRACGAMQASTQRQQGTQWRMVAAGHGPAGTYVSLSETELFPGDSGGPACLGSTNQSERAHFLLPVS